MSIEHPTLDQNKFKTNVQKISPDPGAITLHGNGDLDSHISQNSLIRNFQ